MNYPAAAPASLRALCAWPVRVAALPFARVSVMAMTAMKHVIGREPAGREIS